MSEVPVQVAGLPCLNLRAADGATAVVSPWGAQVLSWCPAGGGERLYLSPRAVLDGSAPIRGGVPLCFPQFANFGPLPAHGLARTRAWRVVAEAPGRVTLALGDDDATRALWPQAFACEFTVGVEGGTLEMTLALHNPGSQAWPFQAALHTYLRVGDIAAVHLHGLGAAAYLDRVHAGAAQPPSGTEPLVFHGECDRIYPAAPPALRLSEGGRALAIEQQGFADTVVWNPGPARAVQLADLGEGEARRMLCVEAACAVPALTLAPGQRWRGVQRLRCDS